MKKLNFIIVFVAFITYDIFGQAPHANLGQAPTTMGVAIAKGRVILNEMLSEYPGVSISVGIKDSIVWSEGFGYADVSKNKAVNPDHQFRYYSLSKSITGMALIKLMESGQIDIEKSAREYLPDLPEVYQKVLIKHLIAHTAGIRNYNKGEWLKISQDNCWKAQDALSVFINDPLVSEPGESMAYSSFGYVLLSAIIESASGKNFIDYLNTMIFEPLGINSISMDGSSNQLNEVTYYEEWNSKKTKGKVARPINNTCKFGAGGLVGTTNDFIKLHLKMLNNDLSTKSFTTIYYSSLKKSDGESVNYAFGIGDNISETGIRTNSHSGSGIGGNAVFIVYPDHQLVIAIAGNIESKEMNTKIGEIAKLFLDLK